MNSQALAILGSGMVSGVGLNAPASCAAIRCGISNFQETRFMDSGGEWIMGSPVHLEKPWCGPTKLARMLVSVLKESLSKRSDLKMEDTPILLCLAEKERRGQIDDLEYQVLSGAQECLGIRFHPKSAVFDQGRVGLAAAIQRSCELIHEQMIPNVIIAGVDSMLVSHMLRTFEHQSRLLTSQNSNGFVPGEAAAAVLVSSVPFNNSPQLMIRGLGFGTEKATEDSELPLRANGLVQAIKAALLEAGCTMAAMNFRMTDISGGQYSFKGAALALARTLTEYKKEKIDIWHPADCIGEVGAAIGVVMLAVCLTATQKGYAPGTNILCHLSNEDERRAAIVLTYRSGRGV